MPAGLLATLSRTARQAYPIIQRAVREGLSSRAITTLLQEHNLGIRRQSLLDIMRAETGIEKAGAALRYIRYDRTPDPERLPRAITKTLRDYSFKVRIRGADPFTGESLERFVTVASDKPLTRGQLEATAFSFLEEAPERYQIQEPEFTLWEGVRAGELGALL